jgi:aerobic-type carbon monoxide dehydrogenase small subunit (CoxS/CutS family)
MMSELTLHVNGQDQKITVDDPDMPLLYALRDDARCLRP